MIRFELAAKVRAAIKALQASGEFNAGLETVVEIADTKSAEHGDFATNVALTAGKSLGGAPREVAEKLANRLAEDPDLTRVEVAGPGFINLHLAPSYVSRFVGRILEAGESLPRSRPEDPIKVNIEFVSVNPNGPITVGSGRGAAFGDTLCRVLETAGHQVHREYYINDGVNSEQMRLFAESVRHFVLDAAGHISSFPDGGYRGDYVEAVAREAVHEVDAWIDALDAHRRHILSEIKRCEEDIEAWKSAEGSAYAGPDRAQAQIEALTESRRRHEQNLDRVVKLIDGAAGVRTSAPSLVEAFGSALPDIPVVAFQKRAQDLMIRRQREDLAAFGVSFDTWFSEQSLHDSGEVAAALDRLKASGTADEEPYRTEHKMGKKGEIVETIRHTEEPGALWLRSTKFGDDQDRVLRRSDGRLTYIASDVAYHNDKFNRPPNADKLMTVLGPDHHGYVARLGAVVQALGYRPEQLEVVIFQIVRFVKEGKPAPMRKRDGNIYALIDLIDEIGRNAAPEASPEEQRRIGADVSRFFYLMRSHDTHMDFDIDLATKQSDDNPLFYVQYAHARICSILRKAEEEGLRPGDRYDRLTHPNELGLVKKIVDLPYEVERCARDYGVHRLTTYAVELARAYHHFYDACRVIQTEDLELSGARLALCQAAATGLRGVLGVLGISAPERLDRG